MSSNNGDRKLQEALINLLNSEIKLAERQAESDKRWIELKIESERQWLELKKEMWDLRFTVDKAIDVLNKHTITLENLPNAVKEKIGFNK